MVISFIFGIMIGLHLNYKIDPNSGVKFVAVNPKTFREVISTKGTADMVAIYFQYNSLESLIVPHTDWILLPNEMRSNQLSLSFGSRFFMVETFTGPLYMTFYLTTFDFRTGKHT